MFSAHVLSPQFNDSITDLDRATTIHGGNAHGGSTYSGANAAGSSGGNWSILVVDAQRIRRVTFPAAYAQIFWGKQARFREEAINHTTTFGHSNLHGIRSCGMVRTVAGQAIEGDKDGQGSEASFHSPEGIAVDASGRAFVVDAGSCRVRRLTYANQVRAVWAGHEKEEKICGTRVCEGEKARAIQELLAVDYFRIVREILLSSPSTPTSLVYSP